MNGQRDFMVAMPSILLLVAVAIGIYSLPPSLDTRRPEMPPARVRTAEDIPARLWQDPLQAYWDLSEKEAQAGLQNPATILQGRLSGRTLMLPILIPGSSYAESHELRLRTRYAVLTALGAAGYVPEQAEKIGVFEWAAPPPYIEPAADSIPAPMSEKEPDAAKLTVPFEWHKRDADAAAFAQVLVLWVDEESLGNGFLNGLHDLLHALVDQLEPKPSACSAEAGLCVELIGPYSSTGLEPYAAEGHADGKPGDKCSAERCPLDQVRLNSPWSTRWPTESGFRLPYAMKLRRTIGGDEELCQLLLEELERRGAVPSEDGPIVLITEWDTGYGRTFPNTFRSMIKNGHRDFVQEYTYLRGIDGLIPGGKKPENKSKEDERANPSGFLDIREIERPEGRSQFDYLRRMQAQLSDERHKGKIKAIGVTGTDVYDKLLILRALRPSFPDTIFFTTDLDVRLLHPSDYPATRNLLIASHFGLGLGEDLAARPEGSAEALEERFAPSAGEGTAQEPLRHIPLFRYSYQSSSFLAVRAALDPQRAEGAGKPSWPRIYEVGRRGGVLLNGETRQSAGALGPFWALALLLASIAISLWRPDMRELRRDLTAQVENGPQKRFEKIRTLLTRKMAQISTLYVGWLLLRLLPFAVLALIAWLDSQSRDGERWSLFGGISIWPTQFILLLIVMLAIEFAIRVLKKFETAKLKLDQMYFHVRPEGWQRGELEWTIPGSLSERIRFCWKEFKTQSLKELRMLGTFARASLENPVHQWGRSDVLMLWEDYRTRTSPGALFGRMLFYGLFAAPAVGLVFYWAPQRPFRGPITHCVDLVLLMSSLVAIAFLLLQVWDVTFFTSQFIRKLAGRESHWPKATVKAYTNGNWAQERYTGELVSEWLDINFIARHTETVSKFIYLPFVLLLLYAAAHHPVLDNWVIRPREILIFLGAMLLACIPLLAVRKAAEAARQRARDRLRVKTMQAQGSKDSGPRLSVLQRCLSDIDSIRGGAFSPLSENPVLRAVMIPFGGIGGMALLDFLLT